MSSSTMKIRDSDIPLIMYSKASGFYNFEDDFPEVKLFIFNGIQPE